MAVYTNHRPESPLAAVELTPVSDGNFTFFYVGNRVKTEEMKRWLVSPKVRQEIVAQAVVDGQDVLVTHGNKPKEEIMALLAEQGKRLQIKKQGRGLSETAWPLRSALGIAGQTLQLSSSLLHGKRDWGLFTFAVSNLAANGLNVLFGAQRSEDIHRLRFLKTEINEQLSNDLPYGQVLPGIHEKRSALRREPDQQDSTAKQVKSFLRRNSVTVGEIGLRYLGALSLAFPSNTWSKASKHLSAGRYKQAYAESKDPSELRHYAGLGSLTGKTVALFSKSEDTFNPKPDGLLDTIREKFTFRAGGLIEAASFATLAYDGFVEKNITFPDRKFIPASLRGQTRRDYLSGIGAALFTGAYLIRNWAKFGVKDTDMNELYAHVSDSLAKMPPEKLPQLMAETAAFITDHFRDKHLDFGKVFTELTTDLYRYHHITLDNPGAQPEERIARFDGEAMSARKGRPSFSASVGGDKKSARAKIFDEDTGASHTDRLHRRENGAAINPQPVPR